jgi:hypothetical protein
MPITATAFNGSGSTSDAVDLATDEVNEILRVRNGGTGLGTNDLPAGTVFYGSGNDILNTLSSDNAEGKVLTMGADNTLEWHFADVDITGIKIDQGRVGIGLSTNESPLVSLDLKGALALRKNGRDGGTSHITDLVSDIGDHSNWFILNVGDTSYFRLTDGANNYGRRVILTGARQEGQIVIIENADEDWTSTNRRGFYIQQQHGLSSSTFGDINDLFGTSKSHLNLKYRTVIAFIFNGSAWVELFRTFNVPQIDSPDDTDDPD